MIEVVWNFGRRNCRRNATRILATTHPYLSALIALALVSGKFEIYPINIGALVGVFTTYDTVVFGFTATAIALAIAIPSPTFIRFLSSPDHDGGTPFRDFLFILAWNGVVHILAFLLLLPAVSFELTKFAPETGDGALRVYLFLFFWVQSYAVFQFLVTTISVYELGDLYANYVSHQRREDNASGVGKE